MMYYYGFNPWSGFGFGIINLLFWIVIIFVILAIIRGMMRGRRHWSDWEPRDRSTEILKERYAKGEITKEQFESMKKDLGT